MDAAPGASVTARVGVTLAVPASSPAVDALSRDLQREVVDVAIASIQGVLQGADPDRSVVLAWFAGSIDAELCARLVAWADARRPRIGLIAWAPSGAEVDAETALDAGFDDAVIGERSSRELAARIRAVHRRVHWRAQQRSGRLRHGGLLLDTDGHELWVDGRSLSLTGTEMSVVRALMRAGGRTMTRAELLDHAWGSANFEISERAVDNVILRLRRKLGKPDLIQTVRGVGFRLATD
jgi:DNA-binding response OmpR family regulator